MEREMKETLVSKVDNAARKERTTMTMEQLLQSVEQV